MRRRHNHNISGNIETYKMHKRGRKKRKRKYLYFAFIDQCIVVSYFALLLLFLCLSLFTMLDCYLLLQVHRTPCCKGQWIP